MSNDQRDVPAEPVNDETVTQEPVREERVLGPGADGDIENPALAPEWTTPLEPIGNVGVTDGADVTPVQVEPVADTINAPATEATHEGTES